MVVSRRDEVSRSAISTDLWGNFRLGSQAERGPYSGSQEKVSLTLTYIDHRLLVIFSTGRMDRIRPFQTVLEYFLREVKKNRFGKI